jgi:hypothetical protein
LESIPEQQLLFGNPYRDRKVVLSKELINSGALTEPIFVESRHMIERFIKEVQAATLQGYKENRPVLLMVFCHGLEPLDGGESQLLLDCGSKTKGIKMQYLNSVLHPGCRVNFVTTACYSGGYTTSPDFNITASTAADARSESNSWNVSETVGRFCGSVFASNTIDTLNRESEALMNSLGLQPDTTQGSIIPDNLDAVQTKSYNGFCRSIMDNLSRRITRLHLKQTFSFRAQDDRWDDSWTGRTGYPLAHYRQRWDRLPTHRYVPPVPGEVSILDQSPFNPHFNPNAASTSATGGAKASEDEGQYTTDMMTSIHQGDVARMGQLFLQACPGDWNQGPTNYLFGYIKDAVANPDPDDEEQQQQNEELFTTLLYRWDLCRLADSLVYACRLPRPGSSMCIFWDEDIWNEGIALEREERQMRFNKLMDLTAKHFKHVLPLDHQGYPYNRPRKYVVAAILQANKSFETAEALINTIGRLIHNARAMFGQAVKETLEAPTSEVREEGRSFMKTLGKRLRSLSPMKRHQRQKQSRDEDSGERRRSG